MNLRCETVKMGVQIKLRIMNLGIQGFGDYRKLKKDI
jgi:hypothetical protein